MRGPCSTCGTPVPTRAEHPSWIRGRSRHRADAGSAQLVGLVRSPQPPVAEVSAHRGASDQHGQKQGVDPARGWISEKRYLGNGVDLSLCASLRSRSCLRTLPADRSRSRASTRTGGGLVAPGRARHLPRAVLEHRSYVLAPGLGATPRGSAAPAAGTAAQRDGGQDDERGNAVSMLPTQPPRASQVQISDASHRAESSMTPIPVPPRTKQMRRDSSKAGSSSRRQPRPPGSCSSGEGSGRSWRRPFPRGWR